MTDNRRSALRSSRRWLAACFLVAQPVLAGLAMAADPQPVGQVTQQTGKTQELTKQQAQLVQHQAEVKRLQQHVSQLESTNGQASTRLQQQDRDIAELKRQLKAAQATAPAGSGHP